MTERFEPSEFPNGGTDHALDSGGRERGSFDSDSDDRDQRQPYQCHSATLPIEEEDMYTAVWVDNEEVLNDEQEIGGLAMTTEAIRALIAGE